MKIKTLIIKILLALLVVTTGCKDLRIETAALQTELAVPTANDIREWLRERGIQCRQIHLYGDTAEPVKIMKIVLGTSDTLLKEVAKTLCPF